MLYTPLLMLITFLVVQFGLAYLGNQVAAAAAREGSRIARVGGGTPASLAAGEARARTIVATIGHGLCTLDGPPTARLVNGGEDVQFVVRANAEQVIPRFTFGIDHTVTGPVERFRADTP
ncbi:hypothetical protein GCM10025868_35340 [Angustibacter aerolatus]|uniref:TadE-like domain-containing protein n=1 Tax=Angustibacter aerolatus TaxID=1162965 RepID=A0ABQ6JLS0_9ACTN|nr:TadE family protein [Angustibacter aerolatus]GMA88284.1 hypothetical protein GCM10025868_35340 [Angustibacter aerolatus]